MIAAQNGTLSDEIRQYFEENLGQALPSGPQVNICCPLHEDESPSFSMDLDRGLWTCYGGCGHGNFPQLRARIGAESPSTSAYSELPLDMQEEIEAERAAERIAKRPTAAAVLRETTYPYHDEAGTELFRLIRYDLANGSKTFKSERPDGKGNYVNGIAGVRRVLYRLPEVSQADLVIILEGEKCADAVSAVDLSEIAGIKVAATCNYGGAGKWRPEYDSYFAGKSVVLLPDNDDKGRDHMNAVARSLKLVAHEIKILELPNLPEKGDVVEFIAACKNEAAKQLADLIETAHPWPGANVSPRPPSVMSMCELFAYCPEKLEWLVEGLMLRCGLSLVGAKPKVAKSFLVRNLAACVAKGMPFLDRHTKSGPVVYISLEDSPAIVRDHFIRLGVAQADPITFVNTKITADELRDLIRKHQAVLVIIDTLYRFAGIKKIDDYVANMEALASLDQVCRESGVHICVVHHAGKGEREDDFDSILGSTALFGGVETCILLKRNPKNHTRSVVTRSRCARELEETMLDFDPATGRITLGKTVELIQAAAREEKAMSLDEKLREYLCANPSSTEEDIQTAIQGKAQTVRTALNELMKNGFVTRTGKGRKNDAFRYTFQPIPVEEEPVEI
jgi:hypothetical protein